MPTVRQKTNNTRSKDFYLEFPPKGKQFSDSFFPHFTKSWNNLDISLQNEYDKDTFKDKLKIKIKPKRYKHFS